MATYIQGVTDYIPQIQQFKPDFNFYSKALQMKQGQYDANHKQLSSLYGSLLNAPMLREGNIEARDQFFKVIDQDIKKMSGMDLSLQQNVDAGAEVFNQLLDNENIVKDMVWTKGWQKENQRADGFRNCVDPDKCGGSWWEGGAQALQFQAQDFKNATDEQAMGMANSRFTPYQDVMKKAMVLAKDAGLSISVDQLQGGYITTTKNGPMLTGPLQELFMGSLGKDPAVMEYYKTKSYVDRKNWVAQNTPTYGSEEAASSAYYNQMTSAMNTALGLQASNIEHRTESTNAQKKELEKRIETEGTTQDSSLAEQYREMNNVDANYNSSKEVIDEGHNNSTLATKNGYSNAVLSNLDAAMAAYSLGTDIGNAAQTLAYKDYEFKMKADPYSLEGFKQKNRIALEDRRTYNDMLIEKYKYDLEQVKLDEQARGTVIDNMPHYKKLTEGGITVADADGDGYVSSEEATNELQKVRGEIEGSISKPEQTIMGEVFDLTKMQSQSEGGKGAASDDMVKFMDAYVGEITTDEQAGVFFKNGENSFKSMVSQGLDQVSADGIKSKWSSLTDSQKLQFAQTFDFDSGPKLNGGQIDNLFNNVIVPSMDTGNDYNKENKKYLGNIWADSEKTRGEIQYKNRILEDLNGWQVGQAAKVIQDTKVSDPKLGKKFEAYIDPKTGFVNSKFDYATKMAENAVENYPTTKTVEVHRKPSQMPIGDPMDRKMDRRTEGVGYTTKQVPTTKADKDYAYKRAYDKAIAEYGGQTESEGVFGGYGKIGYAFGPIGIATHAIDYGTSTSSEESLNQRWAKEFGKHADAKGQLTELGLVGMDSYAVQGINFAQTDPSKYLSEATLQTTSFMKNAMMLDTEDMRIKMGSPGTSIPGELVTEHSKPFLDQLNYDIMNMRDPEDNSRPIMNVTYQDIAGNSRDWTAMNVKLNTKYLDEYVEKTNSKGVTTTENLITKSQYNMLLDKGVTVYIKKDAANNGFRSATQRSETDKAFFYTGEHKFDSFPDLMPDPGNPLMLTKDKKNGGYMVTGNIAVGMDQYGKVETQPVRTPYGPGSDINRIIADWNELLSNMDYNFQGVKSTIPKENLITDPSQLLNQ
jgi:hypothetical protein